MATGTVRTPTWRYVGSSTGTTAVALPNDTDWSEVFVKAYFPLNDTTVAFAYVQPRQLIATAAGTHGSRLTQGFSGQDNQVCAVGINWTNGVFVAEYRRNGTDMTSTTTFDVYVR